MRALLRSPRLRGRCRRLGGWISGVECAWWVGDVRIRMLLGGAEKMSLDCSVMMAMGLEKSDDMMFVRSWGFR